MNFCQYISGIDYSNGYPTSGEGGDYGGGGGGGGFGGRYWYTGHGKYLNLK